MSDEKSEMKSSDERRVLVTGGAGFIGSNFVHYWLENHPGDRVVVLDSLTYAGNLANLKDAKDNPNFRFVHGDIRDADAIAKLLRSERLSTIVHFAAGSHVDRSISGPDIFVDVNIGGTHKLLRAARTVWLDEEHAIDNHRFHHVSTDEVYGDLEMDDSKFEETTPYAPNSPYAASKAASDHLVRAYNITYGLQTTITNCSNNYGPYHFPEKLIPLCIVNLLEGRELPIYGDGTNVRDWLHVSDHCYGIESVLERGRPGETYNIGSDNEQNNLDLVHEICRLVDLAFEENPDYAKQYPESPAARGEKAADRIQFVRDRPGHDRRYAINATKIQGELGFKARMSFADGLSSTIRWYLDNEAWWRAITDQSYRQWIDDQYGPEPSGWS